MWNILSYTSQNIQSCLDTEFFQCYHGNTVMLLNRSYSISEWMMISSSLEWFSLFFKGIVRKLKKIYPFMRQKMSVDCCLFYELVLINESCISFEWISQWAEPCYYRNASLLTPPGLFLSGVQKGAGRGDEGKDGNWLEDEEIPPLDEERGPRPADLRWRLTTLPLAR